MSRLSARWLILSATFVVVVAACAGSDETTDTSVATATTVAPTTTTSTAATTTTTVGTESPASDDRQEFNVSYEQSFYSATGESIWVWSGPGVDEGVICTEMTGDPSPRFENPDGSPLTMAEVGVRNDGTEPFTYVTIGEWTCVDGSGTVTIRGLTEAENPVALDVTITWELTGGRQYDNVTGTGQMNQMSFDGQPVVIASIGTGTISTP